MEWPGKDGFNAAAVAGWGTPDKKYGELRHSGNFSFLRVYGAGHMVRLPPTPTPPQPQHKGQTQR